LTIDQWPATNSEFRPAGEYINNRIGITA